MNRREFISSTSLAIGGVVVAPSLCVGAGDPIAETVYGKVRGINDNGVYVFKGIPYGASTAGANRFMPPGNPQPWTGLRDCLQWGPNCPTGGVPGAGGGAATTSKDFQLQFMTAGGRTAPRALMAA